LGGRWGGLGVWPRGGRGDWTGWAAVLFSLGWLVLTSRGTVFIPAGRGCITCSAWRAVRVLGRGVTRAPRSFRVLRGWRPIPPGAWSRAFLLGRGNGARDQEQPFLFGDLAQALLNPLWFVPRFHGIALGGGRSEGPLQQEHEEAQPEGVPGQGLEDAPPGRSQAPVIAGPLPGQRREQDVARQKGRRDEKFPDAHIRDQDARGAADEHPEAAEARGGHPGGRAGNAALEGSGKGGKLHGG